MSNATTFVGLDVHARSVKACAFVPETGETIRKSFGYEPGEIASWVSTLPQPARCVYESGVTGFHLCRELRSMGVDCVVGAVSKMHKPAADRGWIGYIFLDDLGRTRPAFLNSTGVMYPSVE